MEQDEIKTTIPTENPNAEQDAIRKLLLLRDAINNAEHRENGDVIETLTQLQGLYKELGGYLLTPTAELFPRAMDYFNAHVEGVRALLTKHGVSGETVEAVTQDYGGVLMGQFTFRATPVQMVELLKKIKPYRAYFADKYVLYFGVMKQYAIAVELAAKFNDAFRGEDATTDTKKAFMDGRYSPTAALCMQSLRNRHFFTVKDFDGVEREQVINWLDNLEAYANVGKYTVYYALAALALTASTEQLQAINAPELLTVTVEDFGVKTAQEYAERYTNNVRRKVEEMLGEVIELIEADTAQEREQAKQAVEDWDNAAPVVIGHNSALILSRDIYTAPDAKARDILPITAHIEDYMRVHGYDKMISPLIVEKAVMGINLLQRDKKLKPQNGRYTFYTNISEFANVSYGWDANEEQKKELLHALKILHNLYLVVWKPTGRVAIQLVALKEIGLSGDEKGKLTIEVTAQAMTGDEKPIAASDFKKLQQASKGQAQSHFNGQVLSKGNKGHKREDDLLDEVFGYTFRLDEARMHNATDADMRLIRRNIAANKSNHRKKLLRMFEKAQADGLITFKTRKGKDGGTVYEWVSLMHTKPTTDEVQEPDEQ